MNFQEKLENQNPAISVLLYFENYKIKKTVALRTKIFYQKSLSTKMQKFSGTATRRGYEMQSINNLGRLSLLCVSARE